METVPNKSLSLSPCFYTINDRDMTLLIQQVLSSEARRSAQAGGEGSEAQPNNHGVPALFEGSGSMERQYCRRCTVSRLWVLYDAVLY